MHELVRRSALWLSSSRAQAASEGWRANTKKVYRLWRREGFKVPKKTQKKRRLGHSGNSCTSPRRAYGSRLDLGLHPRSHDEGQPLKWFAIADEYTRECLALEVDRGITGDHVLDILAELFPMRGVPEHIRSDNGPEFIAAAIRRWRAGGPGELVHRAWQPVGERLCRELLQPAAGRVFELEEFENWPRRGS